MDLTHLQTVFCREMSPYKRLNTIVCTISVEFNHDIAEYLKENSQAVGRMSRMRPGVRVCLRKPERSACR
jgi:hypothetical protein